MLWSSTGGEAGPSLSNDYPSKWVSTASRNVIVVPLREGRNEELPELMAGGEGELVAGHDGGELDAGGVLPGLEALTEGGLGIGRGGASAAGELGEEGGGEESSSRPARVGAWQLAQRAAAGERGSGPTVAWRGNWPN